MSQALEMRKGVVSRWKIPPKEGARFGVLYLERDATPYVGAFPNVEKGDEIAVLASLVTHARYGDQYKVQKVIMHVPGKLNLVNWLLLRLPHIGPIRARKIKEEFGDTIWQTLETNPRALTLVDGITDERADKIAQVYLQEREGINVYTKLLQLGVDPNILTALVKKDLPIWHLQDWLEKDVYQLTAKGLLKFAPTDEIGEAKGIAKDDTRRICGAVISILRDRSRDGHTATMQNIVKMEARKLLRVKDDVIDAGIAAADTLPFPVHFSFFGGYIQWAEHAEADLLFGRVLGLVNGAEHVE